MWAGRRSVKGLLAVRAILAVKTLNVTMIVVDRRNHSVDASCPSLHFLSINSFHIGSLPFVSKTNLFSIKCKTTGFSMTVGFFYSFVFYYKLTFFDKKNIYADERLWCQRCIFHSLLPLKLRKLLSVLLWLWWGRQTEKLAACPGPIIMPPSV